MPPASPRPHPPTALCPLPPPPLALPPHRRDRLWRGAGVAVPVFSLSTRESVGAGEFLDLMRLVDVAEKWVAAAPMHFCTA